MVNESFVKISYNCNNIQFVITAHSDKTLLKQNLNIPYVRPKHCPTKMIMLWTEMCNENRDQTVIVLPQLHKHTLA